MSGPPPEVEVSVVIPVGGVDDDLELQMAALAGQTFDIREDAVGSDRAEALDRTPRQDRTAHAAL